MKILHTADLHIQRVGDIRWQALQTVLQLANQHHVEVVIISGDLFDAAYQAEQIRGEIRSLLEGFSGKVILLPGNHDSAAFQDGYFWGNNVQVILDAFHPVQVKDALFWGIPFQKIHEEQIASLLLQMDRQARENHPDARHLLLFHGGLLDLSGNRGGYGEEGDSRYMPVQLAYFHNRIWQYVLAGHFHSSFHALPIDEGKYFVYPGSPVSITRKEIHQRRVNIFRLGSPPLAMKVNTPYFHPVEITLSIEDDWSLLFKRIQEYLQGLPSNAMPLLRLVGVFDGQRFNMNEQALINTIKKEFAAVEVQEFTAIDLHQLVNDDLFLTIQNKIRQRSQLTPEQREDLIHFLIQVMTETVP